MLQFPTCTWEACLGPRPLETEFSGCLLLSRPQWGRGNTDASLLKRREGGSCHWWAEPRLLPWTGSRVST